MLTLQRPIRRPVTCFLLTFLALLAARWTEAKVCIEGTPAIPVPAELWGTLQPADLGSIPPERDTTNYNGTQQPSDVNGPGFPLFSSIDAENGWLFTTYTFGFKVWDATGANAANPVLVATRDGKNGGFLEWLTGNQEQRELVWDVDAPEGVDSVVATVGIDPVGLDIWDTSNKTSPRQAYQDSRHYMRAVWAATINGRHYAFAGGESSLAPGLHVYDMTAALQMSGCLQSPEAPTACPGVYKGRIGAQQAVLYVDGFRRSSDGKTFIVFSAGTAPGGFEIWDVSNPAVPINIGGGRLLSSDFIYGVALWEQGGSQFLGMQVKGGFNGAKIYDLTDCLNGNCGALTPVWTKSWNVSAARFYSTYSKSAGRSYLYFGNEDKCSPGLQREWLFDVTDLATGGQPVDLTPPGKKTVLDENSLPVQVDYWSWYYAGNPTGFSQVMPRIGKVHGTYFYRTAWTLFDVHKLTAGLPPTANFAWSPTEIYPDTPGSPGTLVTFNDASIGVVTTRTWTFQDGSPGSSGITPQSVTFATAGTKQVTLNVVNTVGENTQSQSLVVLNPVPAAGAVADAPDPALVCQNVAFTASGFTGKPPLTYSWEVLNAGNQVVDSAVGVGLTTFSWDNTASQTAGAYTGRVTVTNSSGSAQATAAVQLNALPALQFLASSPTCTNCTGGPPPAPVAGTATFSVSAQGATQWDWDFDNDGLYELSTTDPAVGPNPTKTYNSTGEKTVRVRISNCQTPGGPAGGLVSGPLTINIAQLQPLVASFAAQGCNFNPCGFSVNAPITFTDQSSGTDSTSQWFYDWANTGTSESGCSFPAAGLAAPSTSHTFTTAGTFRPCVKVTRGGGSESDVFVHGALSITNATPPPPPPPPPPSGITIAGPSSGQVNQSLSFSASGSGTCNPSSAGWSWTANGGTISGSGASVSISWSSAGSKNISVTNSACSGSTGTKSVSITDPSTGGLAANFTFDPANPQIGQTVTFNAASSTGAPTTYSWNFGDGESTTVTTTTITHTFKSAGTFNVKLDVGKPNPSCAFGFCSASATKPVTVSGNPPPVASFDTDAECTSDFSGTRCSAEVGQVVTFTSTSTGATSHAWSFGDGGSAANAQSTHAWAVPGLFQVTLTATNANGSAQATRLFVVTGQPVPKTKTVVLPWTAQTRGALIQSSDLYVHNPGTEPAEVTLQFRKKGAPETDPPTAQRTIGPGATLFVPDVLLDLFNRENIAGLITLTVEEGVEPIITSFNTTFQPDGRQFGQTVPGVSMTKLGAAARASEEQILQLVGLNDNSERIAYFGVSNPNDAPATFRLRFFDSLGDPIGGTSEEFTIPRFGQRQFQVKEIRERFGVIDRSDYRVEVESTDGGALVPYASNLRLVSEDPSFNIATPSPGGKVYLVGALSAPGLNDSTWQTDVVLANPGGQVASTHLTFINVGFNSEPTTPVGVDLTPGETQRLANAIAAKWGITDGVGVVTIEPAGPEDALVVQGESYENTDPLRRFGQTMNAFTDADAAGQGTSHYLVGLRQDADYRTTYWLFNPGGEPAEYDVIYLDLNGNEIDRLAAVRLGPGKARQVSPGQHPLPAEGVEDGFTLRILVKSGKVLAGAQVINNLTNDPAYIRGDTR